MKLSARKLMPSIITLLTATAILGVISVLWSGFGEAGANILASAVGTDAAGLLVLCCTGPAVSAWHRAVQAAGVLSACSGLAAALYLLWSGPAAGDSTREGVLRAGVVLWLVAAASAHTALMLPRRPRVRSGPAIVAGTVLCSWAAAGLAANYVLFRNFAPGGFYIKALNVLLILDALGTIVIVLLNRSGQPGPGGPGAGSRREPAPPA